MLAKSAHVGHIALTVILTALSVQCSAQSQPNGVSDSLLQTRGTRVFLDMPTIFHDYIKTEIPYVNYVRDRALAQVHVLLTEEATGSGGIEYTLSFMGLQEFTAINDTLSFCTEPSQSEEIVRSSVVKLLKRGLMRYVEETPFADFLTISYKGSAVTARTRDKWDYWVFSVNCQGYAQGEKTWDNTTIYSYLTANRVTPDIKIDLSIGTNYAESNFDVPGSSVTSITRSQYLSGLIVKSVTNHWSYGLSADLSASTYSNVDFMAAAGPAVEYDVFPYSESTRREWRILYGIYFERIRYIEVTVYDKLRQDVGKQSLSVTYVRKERWGSVETAVSGSNFLYDFAKNRLTLNCAISLNLVKGFSLTLSGNAAMIHDLISPPKGGASYEEILLRQKALDTQYSYYFSFGLRYSFGSIYSNVVNPRFGN
jgi:hypothetical protein